MLSVLKLMPNMKNKMTKSLVISLCAGAIFLSSCKKKDDIEFIMPTPVGSWKVTEYIYGGQDQLLFTSVEAYETNCGFYVEGTNTATFEMTNTFLSNGDFEQLSLLTTNDVNSSLTYTYCYAVYENYTFDEVSSSGSWEFLMNESKLKITYDSNNNTETWDILEWQNNKIKMQSYYINSEGNSVLVKMTLQKI
jgi:hypothetical protein